MKALLFVLGLAISTSAQAMSVNYGLGDNGDGLSHSDLIITYETTGTGPSRFASYVQIIVEARSWLSPSVNSLNAELVQIMSAPNGRSGSTQSTRTVRIDLRCDLGVAVCTGAIPRNGLNLWSPGVTTQLEHKLKLTKNGEPLRFSDGSTELHVVLP